MKQAVLRIHQGLAWLVFAVILVQFFLAGVGVFGEEAFGEDAIGPHVIAGLLLVPTSLVLLILAVVAALTGSLTRGRLGLTALLFVLLIVQFILGGPAQGISPFVAALHPVNALILLGVSFNLAHGRRPSATRKPETATTGRVR